MHGNFIFLFFKAVTSLSRYMAAFVWPQPARYFALIFAQLSCDAAASA